MNLSVKLLNLGCGASYHRSWINIDFVSTGPGVMAHNLLSGIPFPDHSFDAVYHSHVLEHFSREDAQFFITECHRVLKPGGILRVVVPDLEGIVKCYLKKLEECLDGKPGAGDDYDWMLLELFDQMVRRESGGRMTHYLVSGKNKEFVSDRIGNEATDLWQSVNAPRKTMMARLKKIGLSQVIRRLKVGLAKSAVSLIGGKEFKESFKEGIFLNSGESHRWMYDRYSLHSLLEKSSLTDIRNCAADDSRIRNFNTFGLDVVNGVVRKPDSLFVEASKL